MSKGRIVEVIPREKRITGPPDRYTDTSMANKRSTNRTKRKRETSSKPNTKKRKPTAKSSNDKPRLNFHGSNRSDDSVRISLEDGPTRHQFEPLEIYLKRMEEERSKQTPKVYTRPPNAFAQASVRARKNKIRQAKKALERAASI